MNPTLAMFVAIADVVFLIWFMLTLNRINKSLDFLREIAAYTRRTALSLPVTQGQAKLINRSFTTAEVVALLEKNGARLTVVERQFDQVDFDGTGLVGKRTYSELKIENTACLDPELVGFLRQREKEAIELLRQRHLNSPNQP